MTNRADRLAVVLVLVFTALAVGSGLHTGYHQLDVDEVVYRNTLTAMQHGRGYYPAMRDALVKKDGAPPSQFRAIRPPTLFLFLSRFPASWWRWLAGLVYLAILLAAWRLGRPSHLWGGPVAAGLAGLWVVAASPLLFLHAELWGLPFVLGGALAFRNRRWARAAVLLALAVCIRELYAVPLVLALVLADRRRELAVAVVAVVALALVHIELARSVLSSAGNQTRLGTTHYTVGYAVKLVSPSNSIVGRVIGVAGGVLGLVGAFARRRDPAAALLLLTAVVLIPTTIAFGRSYWSMTFGVGLACFAAAGTLRFVPPRVRRGTA